MDSEEQVLGIFLSNQARYPGDGLHGLGTIWPQLSFVLHACTTVHRRTLAVMCCSKTFASSILAFLNARRGSK